MTRGRSASRTRTRLRSVHRCGQFAVSDLQQSGSTRRSAGWTGDGLGDELVRGEPVHGPGFDRHLNLRNVRVGDRGAVAEVGIVRAVASFGTGRSQPEERFGTLGRRP